METGTNRNTGSVSDDGIDYDWLPQSTINELSIYLFFIFANLSTKIFFLKR